MSTRSLILFILQLSLCLSGFLPAQAQGPIDRVFHTATSALQPGDSLHVVMLGAPGGMAEFEILGKTSSQAMQETSPGRYEADLIVPRGLEVKDGIVLVTLSINGKKTAREADRLVTVGSGTGGAVPAASSFIVSPNSTVRTSRPSVSVTFPARIRPRTATLFVDGLNFSSQAAVNATSLGWTPNFDMDPGLHRAEVRATGEQGQSFTHSWQFSTMSGRTGGAAPPTSFNPPSTRRALSVTNLRNGVILGSSFTVEGVGMPGTTVLVTVEHPKMDIVSLLVGRKLRFQSSAQVPANGAFAIQMDGAAVQPGQPMTITVSDTANNPSVVIEAERGSRNQMPPQAAAPTPAPAQAYFDQGNGFGLDIPAGWVRDHSDPSSALRLRKGATEFGVGVGPAGDVATTLGAVKDELKRQGSQVTSEQPVTLSGAPGTGVEYRLSRGGDGFVVVCSGQTRTYIVVAESTATNDPSIRKDLERMLTSFAIR